MDDTLRDYFDRIVVINLDRRPDRWRRFQASLAALDWPFREPVRMPAVDGDAVSVPIWWKQGGGAWGCLMTHARILEDCLREGVRRVLVLEDDVVFVEDFGARVRHFLQHVPEDWDQLYLGGQHLHDPVPLNDHVYRCWNVNRTHCHAVGRAFMPRMYRYILNAHDYIANPGHHIDHRLGALQESGTVKVYAPREWLAGQGEDQSDISGRSNPTFFWNTWAAVPEMTMHVVLGLHMGYANRVAGLMQRMGVHFGHQLAGYESPHVEDAGLAQICEEVFPFPQTERRLAPEQSAPLLHDWCRLILQEAATYGTVGAACYPHLCAMYEDLATAWRRVRVIDVRCPFEEAVDRLRWRASLETGWLRVTPAEAEAVQAFLDAGRAAWRRHADVLAVDTARLDDDPDGVAADLRDFLGLARHTGDLSRSAGRAAPAGEAPLRNA